MAAPLGGGGRLNPTADPGQGVSSERARRRATEKRMTVAGAQVVWARDKKTRPDPRRGLRRTRVGDAAVGDAPGRGPRDAPRPQRLLRLRLLEARGDARPSVGRRRAAALPRRPEG